MRELIIGIIIALLMILMSHIDFFKSFRKFIIAESVVVLVITIIVCLILSRPDILKDTLLLFIALFGLIDYVVDLIRRKDSKNE